MEQPPRTWLVLPVTVRSAVAVVEETERRNWSKKMNTSEKKEHLKTGGDGVAQQNENEWA